jgi:Transposase DDE domain
MPSITHLQTAVEILLSDSLPALPRAARQRLVYFVIGVLLAGTIVLRRVATTHACVALSAAQAASHERRLRRILNDPLVQATPTYGRVVRRVLRHLQPGQRVWLVLDESGHSDVVRVLLAALVYRGRAVPLAWVLWPAQQPHNQSYWSDCATLLAQVATILPAGLRITVLADRAFGCPAFTDLVTEKGWDHLVRVQGQTRLRHTDGREHPLRELLSQAGTRWCGCGQVFKKQGWRTLSVVAYWRSPCREPLLLVSSLPAQWDLVRQYRLRSAIEALFRDWKSSGWQWEASQVREVEHQAVLLVVLALTTLLTLCLGEEAAQVVLAQAPQQGHRRPWAARDSLFRLGRDRLWQRLWQGDTGSITWELRHADAPNWSQECWQAARSDVAPVLMTGRIGIRERLRRLAA